MSMKALGLNATKSIFAKQAELTRPVQSVLNFKREPEKSLDQVLTRSDQELEVILLSILILILKNIVGISMVI